MRRRENFIKQGTNILTVGLHIEIIEDHGYFVAYCPALELSSYGENEEIAKKRFIEEVAIFFDETEKKGTIEKCLLKLGWTLRKKPNPKYIPPKIHLNSNIYNSFTENVTIPIC